MRRSEVFRISEWEPESYVQYPDQETIESKRLEQMNPIKFGVFSDSIVSQFGTCAPYKEGPFGESARVQASIDQLDVERRIS